MSREYKSFADFAFHVESVAKVIGDDTNKLREVYLAARRDISEGFATFPDDSVYCHAEAYLTACLKRLDRDPDASKDLSSRVPLSTMPDGLIVELDSRGQVRSVVG